MRPVLPWTPRSPACGRAHGSGLNRSAALALAVVAGCRSLDQGPAIRVVSAPRAAREALGGPLGERPQTVWAEVLDWGGESAVWIQARSENGTNDSHWRESYLDDSNHGWPVDRLVWSSDSRSAALPVDSSGGHRPYYAPVLVVDATNCETVDVGGLVDPERPVTTGDGGPIRWSPDGKLHTCTVWDLHELAYDPRTKAVQSLTSASAERK